MADQGSVLAEEAYGIYRGMVENPHEVPPHWDDLPRAQRGLLEWTARYALFNAEHLRELASPAPTGKTP